MKQTSRRVWAGLLLTAGFAIVGLVGCSGSGGHDDNDLGQVNLPLTTQGASGVTYRLRDATFVIRNQDYDYWYGEAGAAGTSGNPGTITVSSETNPNAPTISLSLEQGYYNVQLLPGWRMEKVSSSGAQTVEATLISGSAQWVWVARQSTSWAEFSFGIGGREVWLNGKLNIGIDVQEAGGAGGAAGGPIDFPAAGYGGSAE